MAGRDWRDHPPCSQGLRFAPWCCCLAFSPQRTPAFLLPLPLNQDFFLRNNTSARQVQILLEKQRCLRVYTLTLCKQVARCLRYLRRRGRKKREEETHVPLFLFASGHFHFSRKHVFTQIPVGWFLCLKQKAFLKAAGNQRAGVLHRNFLFLKSKRFSGGNALLWFDNSGKPASGVDWEYVCPAISPSKVFHFNLIFMLFILF